MKFFGTGMVWDKQHKKVLCNFENGIYETEDPRHIGILEELGYEYDGEIQIKLDEREKEIEELKKKLESVEVQEDPKLLERVEELEALNLQLKEDLYQNNRAKEILIEKALELKMISKKEAKELDLIGIAEIYNSNLKGE